MWGSIRTNHGQDPAFIDTADNSTFKIEHPELLLKTAPGHPFNWVYPEVRAERLALFEEAVTNYDLDGMEIDFVFSPYLFEHGEVEDNKHLVTEFVSDARRIVDKAAADKGKPFTLGARVLPTPETNAATGLDIADWVAQGLVDFLVPAVYGPMQMDVNFPIEWLVDLTAGTPCEVYPALLNKVFSVHTSGIHQVDRRIYEHAATPKHFRAGAAAYWAKGADGIYLPWFDWPVDANEKQILSEIHDPDLLREKPKHYWSPVRDVDGDYEGYESQLPLTLQTGVEASEQVVHLYLADGGPPQRRSPAPQAHRLRCGRRDVRHPEPASPSIGRRAASPVTAGEGTSSRGPSSPSTRTCSDRAPTTSASPSYPALGTSWPASSFRASRSS